MTEDKTTGKDETPRAAATPTVADPSTPSEPAEEMIELDEEQVQGISGGTTYRPGNNKTT
jgi:hypothetical protein